MNSSSDDNNKIWYEKFMEIFNVPKRIPNIENCVDNVVHAYSHNEVLRFFGYMATPESAREYLLLFFWSQSSKVRES